MKIATVSEIWRYPVKSMAGESLQSAHIHTMGLIGDRSWALVDKHTGDITNAKKHPKLLEVSAHYDNFTLTDWVYDDKIPAAILEFSNGQKIDSRSDGVSSLISELIHHEVELVPLQPPENTQHYKSSKRSSPEDFARMMNIKPGEDIPDFSEVDQDLMSLLMENTSPPGKHVDAYSLHMLTTASIQQLAADGGGDASPRRFRPNLLVEPVDNSPQYLEFSWVGKTLTVGSAVLKIDARTVRCAMPSQPQMPYNLPAAPEVSKVLYKNTERNLGVYIHVLEPGIISVGDSITIDE